MKRIVNATPVFNGNEKKYLNECIDTGWVSANGRFIDEFQKSFSNYLGCDYSIACCNGTVTLHLALKALGIKPGDEVIMPSLTYIATANAVAYCGATPVFVESEQDSWNIDPEAIEKAITQKTAAIIPVHLYGLPANMDKIMQISKKYGIPVIEDAAEAHGAKWNNQYVGNIGDVGSFSFFGNKIITSGEGGMITTNSKDIRDRVAFLRAQGVDPQKRYWYLELGYNYRMTNMQAAVGLAQLENIEWHLEQRQRVATIYKKYIRDISDYVSIQSVDKRAHHVYWMFSIILNDNVKKSRDEVMQCMEKDNIEMRPAFYPMHVMPPYYNTKLNLPIAEKIGSRGINLPSHALLEEEDIFYVVESLKKAIIK